MSWGHSPAWSAPRPAPASASISAAPSRTLCSRMDAAQCSHRKVASTPAAPRASSSGGRRRHHRRCPADARRGDGGGPRHHRGLQHPAAEGRRPPPASSPPRAFATCWRSAGCARRPCSIFNGKSRFRWLPRRHRKEVSERIAADGTILVPLDEAAVLEAAQELVDAGIFSFAVCFLNSYRNPAHEQRAATLIAEHFPQVRVTSSISVLPEAKEYERTSTTVVNAYVRPGARGLSHAPGARPCRCRHRCAPAGVQLQRRPRLLWHRAGKSRCSSSRPAGRPAWSGARASARRWTSRISWSSTWAAPPPPPRWCRTAS